jgi:hypothetical protein
MFIDQQTVSKVQLRSGTGIAFILIFINVTSWMDVRMEALVWNTRMRMQRGIFPDRLKYAIVKPLFKKGDRSCISNYRPISMLSSFSKVFEKVMYI